MRRFFRKVRTYCCFSVLVGYIFLVAVPLGHIYAHAKPSRIEQLRLRYHRRCQRFFRRYLCHVLRTIKAEVRNPFHERFEQPAIIIANHQSLLDLPATLMLHPRIVVMTGDWVWNSPLYRRAVRFAEFFPASMPMDEMLTYIRDVMSRGYSVLIFPEGTRSEDCQIKKFRRGAFHLVEQLKCDVVPVTLWGTGRAMPKLDFCLYSTRVVVEVGQRIRYADGIMGEEHGAMTRYWHCYFLEHYAALDKELAGSNQEE